MTLTDYLLCRPWLGNVRAAALAGPGLLSNEECALLYTLARDYYTGAGAVLDLGCFLGRSTTALAYGLQDNPTTQPRPGVIYSYDKFSVPSATEQYLEDHIRRSGVAIDQLMRPDGLWFRPVFDQTIAPFADLVTTYEGSAPPLPYSGGPIEILFIDISKSEALNNAVIETTFPHLIPGQSIVVQQDFHHYYGWNIHFCMDFFSEYFGVVVDAVGASCVFFLTKPIPPEMIADFVGTPIGNRYSLEGGLQALTRMQSRLTPSYRFHLELNKVRWRANFGEDVSGEIDMLRTLPYQAGNLDGPWYRWVDALRDEFRTSRAVEGASA